MTTRATINPMHAISPDVANEELRLLISSAPQIVTKEAREEILEKMERLLEQGADIHTRSNGQSGITAFMFAAKYCNRKVLETMERMASTRSNREKLFNNRDQGLTAVFFAVQNDDANVLNFFLERIRAVDEVSSRDGCTLLMYAAEAGNVAAITQLIQSGAEVNATDSLNRTALRKAVQSNKLAAVEVLLQKGADVNISSDAGFTALMCAAENPDIDIKIVEKLLEHGANIHARSGDQEVLEFALKAKNLPLVELFLKKDILENASKEEKEQALVDAVIYDLPQAVKLFINAGADPCFIGSNSKTNAIGIAALGSKEVLEILLNAVPQEQKKQVKEDAFFIAIQDYNLETIEFLLEQDVNVNVKDKEGRTALCYIVAIPPSVRDKWDNRLETAELLLQYNANVEITDDNGMSALQYVSTYTTASNNEMRDLLLKFLDRDEDREDGIFPKIPKKNPASSSSADNPPPAITNSQSSSSAIQVISQSKDQQVR